MPDLAAQAVGDFLQKLGARTPTPGGGAASVATHSCATGRGATIVANSDSSIVNGWEYDTKQAHGVVDLLQAQMDWLVNP